MTDDDMAAPPATSGDAPPGGDAGRGRILLALALDHRRDGQLDDAVATAVEAVNLFIDGGWTAAAGRAERLVGDVLADLGQQEGALDWRQAALIRLDAAAPSGTVDSMDPARHAVEATAADRAGCRAALAASLHLGGRHDEAAELLQQAAEEHRAMGMVARAAVCDLDRAVVLHALGRLDEAAPLLADGREVFLSARRSDALAICEYDLGVASHDVGHLDDAVERLLSARSIFESLGRDGDVAACNQNIGVALHAMGRSAEAGRRLVAARQGYADLGRPRDAAQCDHDLAVVLRTLGREEQAQRCEERAALEGQAEPS